MRTTLYSMPRRAAGRAGLAVVAVLVAFTLSACQSLTGDASSSTEAPSPASSAESLAPLTLDDLRDAPVPSACEQPAGTLVDGTLPGIPRENGIVQLKSLSPQLGTADPGRFVAFNPQPADTGLAAVAVIQCDRGGVTWPDEIVAYDHSVHVIGSFSLSDFTGGPNEHASLIAFTDGAVTVDWTAFRAMEPSCCGTLPASGLVSADGDTASMTVPGFAKADDLATRFVGLLAAAKFDDAKALAASPSLVDVYSSNPDLLATAVGDGSKKLYCFDRKATSGTAIDTDMTTNDAMRACTVGAPATDFRYETMPPTVFLKAGVSTDDWTVSNFVTAWME